MNVIKKWREMKKTVNLVLNRNCNINNVQNTDIEIRKFTNLMIINYHIQKHLLVFF